MSFFFELNQCICRLVNPTGYFLRLGWRDAESFECGEEIPEGRRWSQTHERHITFQLDIFTRPVSAAAS
jgi:hypothetical protein